LQCLVEELIRTGPDTGSGVRARTFFRTDEAVVPTFSVAELVSLLAQRGVDCEQMFAFANVERRALENPHARVSYQQLGRLCFYALEVSHDPGLGIAFGQRLVAGRLGLVGYAGLSCPNLRAAIELANKYRALIMPHAALGLSVEGGVAVLELEELLLFGKLRVFATETIVSSALAQGALVLGSPVPAKVRFAYPRPAHADLYGPALGAEVEFDAPRTQIRFDAAWLEAPCVYANAVSASEIDELCAARLRALDRPEGVVEQARRALRQNLSDGTRLQWVARELRVSERSLRRALREAGTSYQRVLDGVRRELALEQLRSNTVPLERVAQSLGFGDVRSFRRAFKRWTGYTPGIARIKTRSLPH
jgi:AraC-like DNA-binding protein